VFLSGGTEVRSLIKNLPAVPEVARLDHLVRSFRESGTTHALVVDEYGGTAGIVTLEQVVWEILGDLFRASEGDSVVKRVGDGAFHVDGSLPIREWNELFEDGIPSDRFETIGGYVVSLLNRLPREGDSGEDDSFRYKVLKVKGRRVRQLEVTERS
jgi:putative hemolysin